MVKQPVISVKQAPLNARRWLLTLQCGHEVWVTSTRHPNRKWCQCTDCTSQVEGFDTH